MELVAVELDGEVVGSPYEVDFVAGDPLVRLRDRKAVALDEAQGGRCLGVVSFRT